MEPLRIGLIIGTTREGRFSEHIATWIKELMFEHPEIALEILDLRDYPFPLLREATNPSYMGGVYPNPDVARWAEKIKLLDGYIAITAEYNHGPAAVLKNAFDVIYGEWTNKPIAFVGYGTVGGARAVEQLRQIAIELQMAPIRNGVHITAPWLLREADGSLKAGALDGYTESARNLFTQLTWWAKTLKTGRAA